MNARKNGFALKKAAGLVLLLLVLLVPVISYGDAAVENFWSTAYDTDYYVEVSASDGGANLRSGAGVDYMKVISGMIPNGTVLHITRVATADNGKKWGLTEYQGNTGWVALSQTKGANAPSSDSSNSDAALQDTGPSATLAAAATAVDYDVKVAAPDGGVNFRCGPGTAYDKIISNTIPNGTQLHISGEGKASNGKLWGLTEYNGQLGWVFLGQTKKVSAAAAKPEQETASSQKETKEETAESAEDTEESVPEADKEAEADRSENDGALVITTNALLKAALAVIALLVIALLLTIVFLTRRKNKPTGGVYGQDMRNDGPDHRRDYRDPWDR